MQLTDPMRRSIVAKLDGLLDLEEAEAMIADIPRDWPVDVVTTQVLGLRLGETEALPDAVIRQLLFWLIPVILTAIGVSVALARMVG